MDATVWIAIWAFLFLASRLIKADIPWAAIGAGILLTAIIVALHPLIFGGNPLG